MTKEQIGKEIKELIRSIKTHYTFVEEEDRIPLIEMELITSKIRKLYEKSIINNYLHSNDETTIANERSNRFKERRSFEKVSPQTSIGNPIENVKISSQSESVETITEKAATPSVPKSEPIEQNNSTNQIPSAIERKSGKPLKDLKLLIGINDKFLLINNLFARNDFDYKTAIEQLSSLHSYSEAFNLLASLARQYAWNTESYAYLRLQQIVEKRYK